MNSHKNWVNFSQFSSKFYIEKFDYILCFGLLKLWPPPHLHLYEIFELRYKHRKNFFEKLRWYHRDITPFITLFFTVIKWDVRHRWILEKHHDNLKITRNKTNNFFNASFSRHRRFTLTLPVLTFAVCVLDSGWHECCREP